MLKHMRKLLLKQGRKSCDQYGVCRFRGDNGTKCPIGMFISEDEYKPVMHHYTDIYLLKQHFPDLKLWEMASSNFWRACLMVHDDASQYSYARDINEGFDTLEKDFPEHVEKEITCTTE